MGSLAGEGDGCDEAEGPDGDLRSYTRIDEDVWRCFQEQVKRKIATDSPPNDNRPDENEDTLTLEEICYERIWQARLRRDKAFGVDYEPEPWERNVMSLLYEELSETLDGSLSSEHWTTMRYLFHPESGEHKSILMKRGPVLFKKKEHELLLFSHGFILCDVAVAKNDGSAQVLVDNGQKLRMSCAYRLSDVDVVERISDLEGILVEDEAFKVDLPSLAFAIVTKQSSPIFVTTSKRGQLDSWLEAFKTCLVWHCDNIDWGHEVVSKVDTEVSVGIPSDWRCSNIDWGV